MDKTARNFLIWLSITALLAMLLYSFATASDCRIAANTILLGLLSSAVAIPIATVVASVAVRKGFVPSLVRMLCVGMLLVPLFLHVSAWDAALGKLGWLSAAQGQVVKPLISGWTAAVWVHAVAAVPQIAVIFLLGMSIGRREYEDQALLDAGRCSVFFHVTLPRMYPLALLGGLWTMVVCAREIAVTDLYGIATLAEQIYLGFSLGQFNPIRGTWSPEQIADAAATGPAVTIPVVGWTLATGIWLFTSVTSLDRESAHQQTRNPPRPARVGTNLSGIGLLGIFALVPAWNLFFRAGFHVVPVDGKPVQSWSMEQLGVSLSRVFTDCSASFTWSALIAVVGATLILFVVAPAVWSARGSRTMRIVLVGLLAISCAIPGPLIGTWISRLFSGMTHPGIVWLYDRTIFAPVLSSVLFCWPVSAMVLWFVFRKVADDSLESAKLEGAGWFSRMLRFGVLANFPALAGCWLISFALCFGELSTTQMVLPPGMDTVPRQTLGLLHAGVDEMTAALTIVTVSGIIVVSLAALAMLRLNRHRNDRQ